MHIDVQSSSITDAHPYIYTYQIVSNAFIYKCKIPTVESSQDECTFFFFEILISPSNPALIPINPYNLIR